MERVQFHIVVSLKPCSCRSKFKSFLSRKSSEGNISAGLFCKNSETLIASKPV